MCNRSVVARLRTLAPFFPTPLLQLGLSLGLAVDCVNAAVRFFRIGTPHFWERRGTAAAGSSPGSLRAGGGSVLDGQCDSGDFLAPGAGGTNTCVLSLAVSFIQAFAASSHHRVENV